jgi:hypothetical protein
METAEVAAAAADIVLAVRAGLSDLHTRGAFACRKTVAAPSAARRVPENAAPPPNRPHPAWHQAPIVPAVSGAGKFLMGDAGRKPARAIV